jgi:peptidoglycan/LPS O-acetylase OafA/YrhL
VRHARGAAGPALVTLSALVISYLAAMAREGSLDHVRTLDGWRALAILLVLFDHVFVSFVDVIPEHLRPRLNEQMLINTGLLGVRIFFGISGFLITSRLIAEQRRSGTISLRAFYLRRVFRILPAAWAFLAVMGILALVGLLPISRGHWVAALLGYANYTYADRSWYLGHFWSLAVEEHFYLVWPTLLILLGTRRAAYAGLAVLLVVPVWRLLDFHFQVIAAPGGLFWGRTDVNADFLAAGALAALLLDDERVRELARRHLSGWRWMVVAALVLAATFTPHLGWKVSFVLMTVTAWLIPPLIIGTVFHPARAMSRLLETRVMRWIGRLSYSLYLWQQVFLVWAPWQVPALRWLQSFPLNVAVAFGFACLSHYLVEQPLIQVGRAVVATALQPSIR